MPDQPTLPGGFPRYTLGPQVAAWCTRFIRQPDGEHAGERWVFTDRQARFLAWFYAVDEAGRWVYRRAALRWAKGTGKSPMLAALALAELCGPVRFSGEWDGDDPVGEPQPMPWVQLAATAEWQTTNTMSMVLAMCPKGSPLAQREGLDIGKTLIYRPGGGRLEIITSSARAAEGNRPTFVVIDEAQEWVAANGGHALARTIRRNLAKTGGRSVEAGNAHAPGDDSVSEQTWDAWREQAAGKTKEGGILYDAVEAPVDTDIYDEESLRAGLREAYADAPWQDLERVVGEVHDLTTPEDVTRRYYLNLITAASDSWLAEYEVRAVVDAVRVVADRDVVTLGFDGSRKRTRGVTDATALVGCRVSDGHLFELGVWEQPTGPAGAEWEVPVLEVETVVAEAFRRYRVVGFYADPAKWESQITTWEATYGPRLAVKASRAHPIEWWMTGFRSGKIGRATDALHDAIVDRECTFDGSSALARHLLNARGDNGTAGTRLHKPDINHKIDAAVAAVLAFAARSDAVAAGVGIPKAASFVPARIR